jgi:hypothetical protein
MARLFDAYVMVDWSAASKPSTGGDSIWIGVMKRDVRFRLAYSATNPATRFEAEKQINAILDDLAKRSERVLLGFDFPLGFPAGVSAALKLKGDPPWAALHAFLAREIKDKPDNANNRFQVASMMNRIISGGPFPFWGCPPKDALTTLSTKKTRAHEPGDLPEFRAAELVAKGASPVWKLYTAGNVGSQTLMGIPLVARIRKARANFRIWPFETGWKPLTTDDLSGVAGVMAEIYPSLYAAKPQAGEAKDAAQVRAVCEHFSALDEAGKLGGAFGPQKGVNADAQAVEREEGWVLGV